MLSQFAENFEMDDLVPEILSILNFLLFFGEKMIFASLDNALDRQPSSIPINQRAKNIHELFFAGCWK